MVDVMGMGEISGDETEILGGLLDGQETKRNLKSRIASEGGVELVSEVKRISGSHHCQKPHKWKRVGLRKSH